MWAEEVAAARTAEARESASIFPTFARVCECSDFILLIAGKQRNRLRRAGRSINFYAPAEGLIR